MLMLLSGLNDPPTSLSSQSKPKLSEISNQWTSLQVHFKEFVTLTLTKPPQVLVIL